MKLYCGGGGAFLLVLLVMLPLMVIALALTSVALWYWGGWVAKWTTSHMTDSNDRRQAQRVGQWLTLPGVIIATYSGAMSSLVGVLTPQLGGYAIVAGILFFATLFAAVPGIVAAFFPLQK